MTTERLGLRRGFCVLFAVFVTMGALLGPRDVFAQKPITIKLASPAAAKQASGVVLQRFADRVKERSGGRIVVEVYPSNSLYGPRAAVEAMQSKVLEMAAVSNGNFAAFQKTLNVLDLPFLFTDRGHLHEVLWGPIGTKMNREIERDTKLKVLWYQDIGGFRQLYTSKKAVRVPEDVRGLKIRTTTSPVEQAIVRAFGGLPTFVDWGETYSGLQQGVVDGELLLWNWLVPFKHHEVIRYALDLDLYAIAWVVLVEPTFFSSLPADMQKMISEEADQAAKYAAKLDEDDVRTSRKYLVDKGVKVYTPTPAERSRWRSLGVGVWEVPEVVKTVDMGLVKEIGKAGK
ncbi:MAG: TRAP transporter substrate-binding protein [Candidatus Rokubacteria bacterium]|nr:TRAP transporter substrate-binding protein [Candidatus Rokubacteria bacterium]